MAGSRLFVEESIFKRVVDELVERVRQINVGDPTNPKTEMGALISREHMDKVESYIQWGKKEGKLLVGGIELPS